MAVKFGHLGLLIAVRFLIVDKLQTVFFLKTMADGGLLPGVLPVQRPAKPSATTTTVTNPPAPVAVSAAQFAVPAVAPAAMAQTQAAIIQKLLQSGYVLGRLPTDDQQQQQQPFVVSGAGVQPLQLVTLGPAAVAKQPDVAAVGEGKRPVLTSLPQAVAMKNERPAAAAAVEHSTEASAAVLGLLQSAVRNEKAGEQPSGDAGVPAVQKNSVQESSMGNVAVTLVPKQVGCLCGLFSVYSKLLIQI